ncbi:EAL domain-containing protein [Azospirillum oleiclasticum]|uniref:EAL domain-containing protein n=1 Tax=Azospirillum oleiclasticum TaxID=2735135 RepID=UPI0031B5D3A2
MLIIHSYHDGYEWTDGQAAGIAEALAALAPDIEPEVHYLDWKRHPDATGLDQLAALIRHRHGKGSVKAIVTTDDAALGFGLRLRDTEYGAIPLIHGGVLPAAGRDLIAGRPETVGVTEVKDIPGTVALAMAAGPHLRRIHYLRDTTESGIGLDAELMAAVEAGQMPLELHTLPNPPFEQLLRLLETLPSDSAILLGTYADDGHGLTMPPTRFLERMSERSAVPIFGLQEYLLGHGLAGGSLLSARAHGRAVGELAAAVLKNGRVEGLLSHPRQSSVRAIDHAQFQRFGLSVDLTPPPDVVVNKPFSVFDAYRTLIIGVGGVILILAGMVIALASALSRRWRAEAELRISNRALIDSRRTLEANLAELTESREKLRDSERSLRLIAEASRDIIWNRDFKTGRRVMSGRVQELLGVDPKALATVDAWYARMHPADIDRCKDLLRRHLKGETAEFRAEYRMRHRDGYYIWIYATGKALFDEQGQPTIMAGSYTDITAEKVQQARLDHLAHYDQLTGLPNRLKLSEHVDQLIRGDRPAGGSQSLSLLFLDMDNFKFINDSFGHRAGDDLLVDFGQRILRIAGEGTFVSRLGGDEFVIVVPGTAGTDAMEVARRLEQGLAMPFLVEGQNFFISASIGIARHPWDGRSFDELLQNADTAMYWAKDNARGRVGAFTPDMNRKVVDRVRLLTRIRHTLDDGAFTLVYQPQASALDRSVRGFEALVRWTDSELGTVSPARFIPACEESGLIVPLGMWVLETACAEAVRMKQRGLPDLTISVNVSVVQLAQPDFVSRVLEVLERTGLPAGRLELEITESLMMGCFEASVDKLNELCGAGVRLALDDFGTGYSSLTYLRRLPIHTLKLDKGFIDDVHRRSDARSMVASIVRIARDLKLSVVAEGVEEEEQWDPLARLGCDTIQGWLVSRPLPPERIAPFLADWDRKRAGMPVPARDVVVDMMSRA